MTLLHFMSLVWAFVLTAFTAVMIYRGYLNIHETDQLFLSDNSDESRIENHNAVVRRAERVEPIFTGLGGATAAVSVLILGTYLIQQIPNMRF